MATIYNERGDDKLTYEYVTHALACIPHTDAETSPRLAKTMKRISKFLFGPRIEKEVDDIVDLEEEDCLWIYWGREFKATYEAEHTKQKQETE